MSLTRLCAAALLCAAVMITPAQAGTHVILVQGLFGWLVAPLSQLSGDMRARGASVAVYSWTDVGAITADACAHRGDRVVIVGHSLGGPAATQGAMQAKACGAHVSVVSVDPPAIGASVRGVPTTNFVGALGGSISGASNVRANALDHLSVVTDAGMRRRIVGAALGGAMPTVRHARLKGHPHA